jgi:hypothetical protein
VKVSFYIAGAVFEGVGILSLGLPDLIPYGPRVSRWLSARYVRTLNRLLLRIGRPRRQVVELKGIPANSSGVGRPGVTNVENDLPIEQQVALLREHDKESRKAIDDLRDRLETLERGTSRRLEESRGAMEAHVAEALSAARAEYQALRIAGAILLVVGLGLSTAGNLVS